MGWWIPCPYTSNDRSPNIGTGQDAARVQPWEDWNLGSYQFGNLGGWEEKEGWVFGKISIQKKAKAQSFPTELLQVKQVTTLVWVHHTSKSTLRKPLTVRVRSQNVVYGSELRNFTRYSKALSSKL